MAGRKLNQRERKATGNERRWRGRRRPQVLVAVAVALSVFAAWTLLAYSGALDSVFGQRGKDSHTVSTANFNSNSPSREYIYAGSKLVATEEPSNTHGPGLDTIGLYDPAHAAFFLRNSNTGGNADITSTYGPAGLGFVPLVGDWNGDGVDTIGLYDPAHAAFFLSNSNTSGSTDITFTYGPAGLGFTPLAGDWNGDPTDTIGLYDPAHAAFFLRNSNSGGVADVTFTYGPAGLGFIPLAGDWDGQ
jgi:hypothetical protein